MKDYWIENNTPDTTGLVITTDCDIKIAIIENEIPDVIDLTKKTYFDTKLSNISNRVTSNETKELEIEQTKWSHSFLYKTYK